MGMPPFSMTKVSPDWARASTEANERLACVAVNLVAGEIVVIT